MTDAYLEFLRAKTPAVSPHGLDEIPPLHPALKPFQRDIVAWALRGGRRANFSATGLGKTLEQLAWAEVVARHEQGPVLILTPLAVAEQTVAEAMKFKIEGVAYAPDKGSINGQITVTNYDRLEKFDPAAFAGVVLDESSIIKAHDSKSRSALIEAFGRTPWRFPCSATPAPNDWVELGQHAEFLGVMTEKEMLATYFVHDGSIRASGNAEWRLKRHAEQDFWRWLASWAVVIRSPADLGYDEPGYDLPPLQKHQITVPIDYRPQNGILFPARARTLSERIAARRDSIDARVHAAAELVARHPERPWLLWCGLNEEANRLEDLVPGAEQVQGSDSRTDKSRRLLGFTRADPLHLISKPSIAGFGMNYQHCADMVFVGLNDSFEQLFQAIRRCWRFGQTKPVNVWLIASELEGAVVENLNTKERDYDRMCDAMAVHMRDLTRHNLRGETDPVPAETAMPMEVPAWLAA